jgi:tryptophanyl-tRNA synthetase
MLILYHQNARRTSLRAFDGIRRPVLAPSCDGRWRRRLYQKAQLNESSVIFSGIQPTGIPHLGNYLGALLQWVKLQEVAPPQAKLIFSVVDLHAITVRQDPQQLRRWKRETLAMLMAVGLDPARCLLFYQSSVGHHAVRLSEREIMAHVSCRSLPTLR